MLIRNLYNYNKAVPKWARNVTIFFALFSIFKIYSEPQKCKQYIFQQEIIFAALPRKLESVFFIGYKHIKTTKVLGQLFDFNYHTIVLAIYQQFVLVRFKSIYLKQYRFNTSRFIQPAYYDTTNFTEASLL